MGKASALLDAYQLQFDMQDCNVLQERAERCATCTRFHTWRCLLMGHLYNDNGSKYITLQDFNVHEANTTHGTESE